MIWVKRDVEVSIFEIHGAHEVPFSQEFLDQRNRLHLEVLRPGEDVQRLQIEARAESPPFLATKKREQTKKAWSAGIRETAFFPWRACTSSSKR
jgi:hypothetical protein